LRGRLPGNGSRAPRLAQRTHWVWRASLGGTETNPLRNEAYTGPRGTGPGTEPPGCRTPRGTKSNLTTRRGPDRGSLCENVFGFRSKFAPSLVHGQIARAHSGTFIILASAPWDHENPTHRPTSALHQHGHRSRGRSQPHTASQLRLFIILASAPSDGENPGP
jgi:hypothetical protein